ncbi:contractile injection system tape measure protein [Puia sp. P3]|uniref:contractile injection system tape measure protein n=1 Tax=Puia sp. P3 TaxID=3423952 RepID=UPI003D672955
MDHIIRRQLLELTLDGRQPPFDLQNRLSDQYYQTLLPVLEKWFDQLAGDEEVLFIDRLVLDLGEFSRRDFDDRLLKQRLIEQLSSPDITRTIGVEALSAGQGSAPAGGGGVQRRSARHNAFEQWIWYMEKGYLPWSLLRVTPEWEHKVLETLATDYPAITRVRSLLTNRPATLTRIAQQHDDIFLMRLTEILTTVVQSPLPQTLQELRRLLIYAVNLETVDYQPGLLIPTPGKAWQDALMLAASLGKEASTETLAHRLLTHYWADYAKFLPGLQDYLTTHPIARDIVEPPAAGTEQSSETREPRPAGTASHPEASEGSAPADLRPPDAPAIGGRAALPAPGVAGDQSQLVRGRGRAPTAALP